MATRTLEHRLKFDHGLTVGADHLVQFTLGDKSRLALVNISARGVVRMLIQPTPGDMYSSWARVTADTTKSEGRILLWAARDMPELMARFDNASAAVVPVII